MIALIPVWTPLGKWNEVVSGLIPFATGSPGSESLIHSGQLFFV